MAPLTSALKSENVQPRSYRWSARLVASPALLPRNRRKDQDVQRVGDQQY